MTLIRTNRSGGCPLCGVSGAACGHPSASVPVDSGMEVAVVGGPLKKYEVTLPNGVVTTMKLNDADAARYGVAGQLEADEAGAESAAAPAEAPAAKKRAPRNKARTAPDKGEGGGG